MSSIELRESKFLFSIIMAVYNVEQYLEEAIKSVINQTLDFEYHTQLILVNDGSSDNSEGICEKYKEKYPNNIIYITKENGGVSSARNAGLKYVEGRYINFLDPDDKLSKNTLEVVYGFFEHYYNDTDVVSIPIQFFEARVGPHHLNYKFNKSRVVDLTIDYNFIQLSSSSAFFKRECFFNRYFDENIKIGEDAELLGRVLLDKMKLGVLKEGEYFYRRRANGSSAVQTSTAFRHWYTESVDNFFLKIIDYSIEKCGFPPKYIQYLVMYELQWRFNFPHYPPFLTKQEIAAFEEKVKEVLRYIDDSIILEQKNLNMHRKMFALSLKNNSSYINEMFRSVILSDNILLYYNNILVNSLKDQILTLEFVEIANGELTIEGVFGSLFEKSEISILLKVNNKIFETEEVDRSAQGIFSLNRIVKDYKGFKLKVPVSKNKKNRISFYIKHKEVTVQVGVEFRQFVKLNQEWPESFFVEKDYIVSFDNNQIIVDGLSISKVAQKELSLLKRFLKDPKANSKKIFTARIIYYICKMLPFKRKIWVLMDRVDKADDNAEYLFRYALQQKDGVSKYFIIKKDTEDYKRLKKVSKNIIPFGSYKHKLLHLLADKVISSHADEWVINPFFGMQKYYKDLTSFKFVFLQHGIITADLWGWLNRYRQNIKLFITSAYPEYDSILKGNYYYDSEHVKLTGLPRFDNLKNVDKKQIVIMPTWRKNLVSALDQETGLRPYNNAFKESKYFHLYNRLINDKSIIQRAKNKGYQIIFFPHPNIHSQIKDFTRNDYVKFCEYNTSYRELFNNSSLLITDYSSVSFDFAYLRKPVLYFHFEKYHFEEGYFNYKKMGFGEVFENYESLVEGILRYIDNDCIMSNEYEQRVSSFYAYNDKNNCKRVYKEIINLN